MVTDGLPPLPDGDVGLFLAQPALAQQTMHNTLVKNDGLIDFLKKNYRGTALPYREPAQASSFAVTNSSFFE
jgi:hypothetical protein